MAGFKDTEGREWHPRVTALTIRRLEEECDVSLFQVARNPELMATTFAKMSVMLRLMYESVIREAQERAVSFDQFCDALGGDEINKAGPIVVEAMKQAFPAPKQGGQVEGRPIEPGDGQRSSS